jgi:hypothetical protein
MTRGLRVRDPDWVRHHHPRWRRLRRAALVTVDVAAVGLVLAGALPRNAITARRLAEFLCR